MARLQNFYKETVVKKLTDEFFISVSNAGSQNQQNYHQHGCW